MPAFAGMTGWEWRGIGRPRTRLLGVAAARRRTTREIAPAESGVKTSRGGRIKAT